MSAERFGADGAYEPKAGAARFDSGWISSVSIAGLDEALASRPAWAHERALETAARCRSLLDDRYEVVTATRQSTLVSFRPTADPAEVVTRLHDRGVVVREIPESGLVRVSCGYWTSENDLERLVDALSV
jgi:L-cysteine/cystine lyase